MKKQYKQEITIVIKISSLILRQFSLSFICIILDFYIKKIIFKQLLRYSLMEQSSNINQNEQNFTNVNQSRQFRCYLRTPDMKCKIQSIRIDQSAQQLKQFIAGLFQFNLTNSADSEIKLIVNEVQLTSQINLQDHLFQNAIIHVVLNKTKDQRQQESKTEDLGQNISVRIKQPPTNCPIYTIPQININDQQMTVLKFKQIILEFYRNLANNQSLAYSQTNSSDIASLQINNLYLVYCGQILNNDSPLKHYNVDQNGIIYVVSGNKYARQVTKQQAQKRIKQVKEQKIKFNHKQSQQAQMNQRISRHIDQNQKNLIFNIIQNIVHDEDSDVQEGSPVSNDIFRSQKIIHRYDSLNEDVTQLTQTSPESDLLTETKDEIKEVCQKSQEQIPNTQTAPVNQFLQKLNEKISTSSQIIE